MKSQAGFWAALAVYGVVGLGGWCLFALAVEDAEWRDIFASVWWVPSGFVAIWVKPQLDRLFVRQ